MLTKESHDRLHKLFFFRKVRHLKTRKFAVPIGLRELTVRKVIERKTKNGKRLVEVWLYHPPSETVYAKDVEQVTKAAFIKASFAPIKCYHVEGNGHIRDFFHKFTAMKPHYLDKLQSFVGKSFMGLVKHTAHDSINILSGEVNRTYDGMREKYWTQEVVAVCRMGETLPFDYFDLVDFGKQDRYEPKTVETPF